MESTQPDVGFFVAGLLVVAAELPDFAHDAQHVRSMYDSYVGFLQYPPSAQALQFSFVSLHSAFRVVPGLLVAPPEEDFPP